VKERKFVRVRLENLVDGESEGKAGESEFCFQTIGDRRIRILGKSIACLFWRLTCRFAYS
jgi:hypothetical protein